MALRRGRPSERDTADPEQFSYTPTAGGAKPWSGWCACEPYFCKAHEVPRTFGTEIKKITKPCLGWITNGALRCPWCKPFVTVPWVAYVFLYREVDTKPVCVIVHDSAFDLLEKLNYAHYAIVGREVGEANSVYVRLALGQKELRSVRPSRQCAADPTNSLLTMWALPELVEWYAKQAEASDSPVSLPKGTAVRENGEPFTAMNQAAAKKNGAPVVSSEEGRRVVNRLAGGIGKPDAQPSTNGKHKPPT